MEKPIRKSPRLGTYDYSTSGGYFVTICTHGKKHILSRITSGTAHRSVNEQPIVGAGVPDRPQNKLTAYGKIADKYINQINDFYETVKVDKYVIMPNHIHMILIVNNPNRELEGGTSRKPSPTNSIVSKYVSTFKRFCNKEYGENIWQRSYHDHIIRDEKDYIKIWGYIDTNVIRWTDDCFYSEASPRETV